MGWTEKEIKENFEEIRLEKGIAAELEKTTQIIKKTGIFYIVDRMYGEPGAQYQDDQQMPNNGEGGLPGGGGGGFGGGLGGGFGGDLDSLGAPGEPGAGEGDINGVEGAEPTNEMGGGTPPEAGAEPTPPEPNKNEGVSRNGKLLTESKNIAPQNAESTLMEYYMSMLDKKAERESKNNNDGILERAEIYDKSLLINEEFSKMINSLDEAINNDDN
jgi:hypothetical protein